MFFAFFAGSKSTLIIYLYIQINGPSTLVVRQNVPCTIERLKSYLRWDVGINFPTFRRAF